ncbi:ribosome maturation factor RimP [Aeromicrobium halocynthiae]|uniref:Ribosome maturation factor RimP n=1 Tax=Aeromicrobium halocynthiae TaxID=560557 RepID=A0ABN2W281_9ACTN
MADARENAIREVVRGPIEDLGLDVESLAVSSSGSKRIVRIAVDADGGVGIDRIAKASRAVSATLDESDVMGQQPYTLEVTSRGLDAPLTAERHWRRAAGRLVAVTLADGASVTGRVAGSDPDGVDLTVGTEPRRLAYDEVQTAVVVPELKPRKES